MGGGGGFRELLLDIKVKRSKVAVFYLTKTFTERLETSAFHDTVIFFTLVNDFLRCSCSCDDQIAQKAAEQVP